MQDLTSDYVIVPSLGLTGLLSLNGDNSFDVDFYYVEAEKCFEARCRFRLGLRPILHLEQDVFIYLLMFMPNYFRILSYRYVIFGGSKNGTTS